MWYSYCHHSFAFINYKCLLVKVSLKRKVIKKNLVKLAILWFFEKLIDYIEHSRLQKKQREKSPRGRFKAVTFHCIIYKMIKNIWKLDRIPFDLLKKCFSDTVIQYISNAEHRFYRIYFADVPQAFNFIKKDSTAGFFLWIILNF